MDLVRIPIVIYDEHGDANLFVNKCFIEEIGYTTEDIPGFEEWSLNAFPDKDYRDTLNQQLKELLAEALKRGDSHIKRTVRIHCKSGASRWYEMNRSVVGIVNVITYNNIDKLYSQNEQLTTYNEQIKMLLSIISHDVRTPLGVLKSMIDSYASLDLSKEEAENLFSSISQEINQTFHVINTALLWISSNNETFSFHAEDINLYRFFSNIKENYAAVCKEKNITIDVSGNKDISLTYDAFILEVVSRNIINNAVKYCFENCIISVIWNQFPRFTDIHIQDDGPGMLKEKIDNILLNREEPNQQKNTKRGFGIGLKIINQCIKKYHGELLIESEINHGSRFTVRIPSND